MESPIRAIGFSALEKEYSIEDIVTQTLDHPTSQAAIKIDDERIIAEYTKEFAENTYIMVRVTVDKGLKEPQIDVEHCEAYVVAANNIEVTDIEIESLDEETTYYGICEDKKTGMQIIFWLQNLIEYLSAKKQKKVCKKVNLAALAIEGTIILPVEKDEEDELFEKQEREKIKAILEQMKAGDEEARKKLEAEEKELDEQLKQRLKEEDFLTIMSGYFIPTTLEDATYALLGEIKIIKEKKNLETKELMYIFTLNVNDMPIEVVINSNDLVGMPSVGMRFMGTCWIQGKVIME